jgi:hypothetical protein
MDRANGREKEWEEAYAEKTKRVKGIGEELVKKKVGTRDRGEEKRLATTQKKRATQKSPSCSCLVGCNYSCFVKVAPAWSVMTFPAMVTFSTYSVVSLGLTCMPFTTIA